MNRKDMQQLAKSSDKNTGDAAYSTAWFKMYCAVVGGQVGWITGAINDPARFKTRLRTLADIATSALDLAILDGKIPLKAPAKGRETGSK